MANVPPLAGHTLVAPVLDAILNGEVEMHGGLKASGDTDATEKELHFPYVCVMEGLALLT
jgi:hypothetical protein